MRAAQEATAPAETTPAEEESPAAAAPLPGPTEADRMAAIRVPVMIIVGDRDHPPPQKCADALVAAFPNARKIVIPGAAHIIPLEQPAAFTQAVLDFLLAVDEKRET
jgi:pimeloyl-ACP methyl ester carboxylesterase